MIAITWYWKLSYKTLATYQGSFKTGKPLKQAEGCSSTMSVSTIAHLKNDHGVAKIGIGVKEFMCCGASEPHDHPHVYLDMGEDTQIVCPYCSTLYTLQPGLSAEQTEPEGCLTDAF
jgi:uncharacterized Zn-finger protein